MQNAHHEKDLFLRRFANDQFDLTILMKKKVNIFMSQIYEYHIDMKLILVNSKKYTFFS